MPEDEMLKELWIAKREISASFGSVREMGEFLIQEQDNHPNLIRPLENLNTATNEKAS